MKGYANPPGRSPLIAKFGSTHLGTMACGAGDWKSVVGQEQTSAAHTLGVCFRAGSRPRDVFRLMSATSQKQTLRAVALLPVDAVKKDVRPDTAITVVLHLDGNVR